MKTTLVLLAVVLGLGFASAITPARADDASDWVKKCVNGNKREGATPAVVAAYCSCIFGRMSDEDTLSDTTAWEKTHPGEKVACDKESGRK